MSLQVTRVGLATKIAGETGCTDRDICGGDGDQTKAVKAVEASESV